MPITIFSQLGMGIAMVKIMMPPTTAALSGNPNIPLYYITLLLRRETRRVIASLIPLKPCQATFLLPAILCN